MHLRIVLVSVFAGGLALGAVAAGVSDVQAPASAPEPAAVTAPAEPVATGADIVAPTQSAAPAESPSPAASPAAPPPAPAAAAPEISNPPAIVAAPPPPSAPADTAQKTTDAGAPAKLLFSKKELPSIGKAMAIGYYPRGCLQGGVELPVTGPSWQVMRVSRNRNWGHPELVRFLERFAPLAKKATGWHGILVGDMAQPRGGPLPFGHKSHQIGLDVDVWFMPMPDHVLNKDEREKTSAINLVSSDWKRINPKTWTPAHVAFIRTAAQQPEVERVLVNAAIKKEMCRMQGANHPDWMDKVRPWYGHHDHIHVRLRCPADSPNCRRQEPVPDGAGCGKELDFWFSDKVLHPKKEAGPKKPPRPLMMADLPPACKAVLDAPAKHVHQSSVN
jgi:penicillin-insensitive murein endopeptidase